MNRNETGRGKDDDIVVFMLRRDATCAECGEELGSGRWLRIENEKPLCMHDDELDDIDDELGAEPGAELGAPATSTSERR